MPRFDFQAVLRAWDANGVFVAGAKLYVYEAGTVTPVTTYSDFDMTATNASPVVANASGVFGDIYVPTGSYKVVIDDAADVTLYTIDNIEVLSSTLLSSVARKTFNTRAQFVADVAAGTTTFNTGDIVDVGGLRFINDGGTGISDLTGWSPTGNKSYPDHYADNTTPGTTDMASALQSAINHSSTDDVWAVLRPGVTYAIGTMVDIPGGTRFDGQGGTLSPLTGLSTTDITLDRSANGHILLRGVGDLVSPWTAKADAVIRNVSIVSTIGDGQIVDGIQFRNFKDVVIEGVHFEGDGLFICIDLDTISGAKTRVVDVSARDIGFATDFAGMTASNAQISLLEVDRNRVNSVDSEGFYFRADGRRLKQSGAALTTLGNLQSDVAAIHNGSGFVGVVYGDDVGEICDYQGTHGNIHVTGKKSDVGFKGIHGCRYTTFFVNVSQNNVKGALLAGGTSGRGSTSHNRGVVIADDLDPSNTATATVAAFVLEDAGAEIAEHNDVKVICKAGTNTDFAVAIKDASDNNTVEVVSSGTFANKEATDTSSGTNNHILRRPKDTFVAARLSANQGPLGASWTTVQFDTEDADDQSEWDAVTNYDWTAPFTMKVRIQARVRTTGQVAASLRILKDGTTAVAEKNDAATRQDHEIEWTGWVAGAETYEVQMQSNGATITGNATMSQVFVTRVT